MRDELVRNHRKRPRVGLVDVTPRPRVAVGGAEAMARRLDGFEDLCLATQSMREGVEARVPVEPAGDASVETG